MLGFFAMALGMFMALLDIQIVAGSYAEIRGGLSASLDEMTWIQTSYLIAESVMIPISGWLAWVFSTRWVFTVTAAAFTVTSLCCSLSWNIESMIVFRALQGFSGGALIPLSFSAGFALFPGPQAALIPAILGLTGNTATALGPVIGGWITQELSWEYLFYLNVIPGLIVITAVPLLVRVDKPNFSLLKGFDALSIPFIAVALGALGYVLEEGVRLDWFDDQLIVWFTIASLSSFAVVIWRGFTHRNPVLDLNALQERNFALSCCFAFIVGVGNYGSVFVIPVFLGDVRGYNSLDIGEALLITGVCQVIATLILVATSKKLSPRLMLGAGLFLYGVSLLWITPLTNQWGWEEFFLGQGLRGFASMFVIVPLTTFALGSLPAWRLPMASGLYNLMRNLGGAVGLACIGILLQERETLHYSQLAEHVTRFKEPLVQAIEGASARFGGLVADPERADLMALRLLTGLAKREALVITVSDILFAMAALFFASLFLLPFLRWPNRPARSQLKAEPSLKYS
jgi:DHA2 family multidrug resistance protein